MATNILRCYSFVDICRLGYIRKLVHNMKAILKNYHQAPRKVRLVADLIRGKRVEEALASLSFLDKKAALPMRKLLSSAVANARSGGEDAANLMVSRISVDKGAVAVRGRPFARGRSGRIHKTMSIVKVELGQAPAHKTAVKSPSRSSKKLEARS
ncbi:MAG: 50S ribosomal protein L22 [Parcubacteria group bacterium GW2011_GWA2_51_10]|nr:MAG: 50S ribosomal protein L22 [Parcubacteria group bacterium GW2011_GWA2_51_10]